MDAYPPDKPRFQFPRKEAAIRQDPIFATVEAVLDAATATSPKRTEVKEPKFRVLVEDDRLVYRVKLSTKVTGEDEHAFARHEDALAQTFCSTFGDVWESIPMPDRAALLRHWQVTTRVLMRDDDPRVLNLPRPLVEIVDDPSVLEPEHDNYGLDLFFPRLLIQNHEQRLPYEIASLLAKVYNVLGGNEFEVCDKTVDIPMERWEQKNPDATEEEKQAKYDRLVKGFFRKNNKAIAAILQRWGFAEPSSEQGKPSLLL